MKKLIGLCLLALPLLSCQPEGGSLKINAEQIKWLVGDEEFEVLQEVTLLEEGDIHLNIEKGSFCAGAFWIEAIIVEEDVILFRDTVKTFPYTHTEPVPAGLKIRVSTRVVEGEELIQCAWLGNAECTLTY